MANQVSFPATLVAGVPLASAAVSRSQTAPEKPSPAVPANPPQPNSSDGTQGASTRTVGSAAEAFSAFLEQHQQELVFQVDQSTGATIFRIINTKTQEVIRQVPSAEILAMARKLRELDHSKGASGVLVDKVG